MAAAAKTQSFKYIITFFLPASMILNLYFIINLYEGSEWNLSWSRKAAKEAEAVAAISCSGHGRAYLDSQVFDGNQPVCECNSCFSGPDCSLFLPGCVADADSGDPLFLEPFWMKHAASSAILIAGWHRMSYRFTDASLISLELEKKIRKLHSITGNAVTENRFIIFGAGSTQLLNAAVRALSADYNSSSSPARVVASIPFYPLYQLQTDYFESVDYKFEGDANLWGNVSSNTHLVEFVTAPNNPDGQMNKAVLKGPYAKSIYDHAYFWPHFTPIPAPADEELMIFTISKITGHAGSRFGWAVIKDEAVYQRMLAHINLNTMGVSRDSQLRAFKLLKFLLEDGGNSIFEFGYNTMKKRWESLSKIISLSNRFSLQEIAPQYCTYFKKIRPPSPGYAWVKCEREEDKECYEILKAAKIIGREGKLFGAESRFVRLSLLKSQDDFDLLLHRLDELISKE